MDQTSGQHHRCGRDEHARESRPMSVVDTTQARKNTNRSTALTAKNTWAPSSCTCTSASGRQLHSREQQDSQHGGE